MADLLDYRYISKQHRQERRAFTCAEPARTTYVPGAGQTHPRPWEIEVQKFLRSAVPGPSEVMLAGWDGQGIAAMGAWRESPGVVQLQAFAVDVRCRHRGGAWAREALTRVLGRAESRALTSGVFAVEVTALIDRRNKPSQDLCQTIGFGHLGQWDSTLDLWGYTRRAEFG